MTTPDKVEAINTSMLFWQWVWRFRWVIALISGAAIGTAYPPLPLGALAWIGFVPMLAVLEASLQKQKRWMGVLYAFGWAWHGAANWWVLSWQRQTDPYLMVAGAALWIVHPLFLIPALALYAILRRRGMRQNTALVFMVLAFVAIEWLHSLGDLSYPWLALGYTQLRMIALVQIAEVTGVWGISGIVIALNATVFAWIARTLEQREALYAPLRASLHLGVRMLGVLAVPLLYGIVRLLAITPTGAQPLHVALVQPSINPWQKWTYADMRSMLEQHLWLMDSLRRTTRFELALWSETAIPVNLLDGAGAELLSRFRTWCDSTGVAVLTGFADIEQYRPLRAYNAAVLIAPRAESFPVHRKSRLTPFGEYMPFSDIVPSLAKALQWSVGISSWVKGPGARPLPLANAAGDTVARIGVMICIESIYPDYCADYVRRGADVLAVITNDAWYDGTTGPDQHFAIAQMRAIETRRFVARCANSGITGFISPWGTIIASAPAQAVTAIAAPVFPQDDITLYVRWGNWLPQAALVAAVGVLGWWRMRRVSRRSEVEEAEDLSTRDALV